MPLAERRSRLRGRGGSGDAIPSLLRSDIPDSPSAAELQKGAAFRILQGKAVQVRRCSWSSCPFRTPGAARGLLWRGCGCWPRGASLHGELWLCSVPLVGFQLRLFTSEQKALEGDASVIRRQACRDRFSFCL